MEAFMRTVNNGIMQGTRVGAGPAGEPLGRGIAVARVVVLYHCANKHQTVVPFIWTVTPPPQWECRVCSQPAGTDPLDPPARVARYTGEKTHMERVRDRRTQVEGNRLMAESLARRDHPEDFDVWAGSRRRTVGSWPPNLATGGQLRTDKLPLHVM